MVNPAAVMWRFCIFPLITTVGVIISSTLYLIASSALILPVMLALPNHLPDSRSVFADRSWGWSVEAIWLFLLSASFLLGVGLAAYERLQAQRGQTGDTLRHLVPNIYWFCLYLSLLTAPTVGVLDSIAADSQISRWLPASFGTLYFSWIGFVIVLLAGIYSMRSQQVLNPDTVIHRLRHGRFKKPTLSDELES